MRRKRIYHKVKFSGTSQAQVLLFGVGILLCGVLCLSGCTRRDEVETALILEEEMQTKEMQTEETQANETQANETQGTEDCEQTIKKEVETPIALSKPEEGIYVYICGAVNNPGVYELPFGSRVFEGIEAAGGYRIDADEEYMNQADILSDGDKMRVPTREESEGQIASPGIENANTGTGTGNAGSGQNGKININTASKDELMSLTGIGSARAEAILQYRQEHGTFQTIEDIMQVSGIKESSFEKIKEEICVR